MFEGMSEVLRWWWLWVLTVVWDVRNAVVLWARDTRSGGGRGAG